MPVPTIISVVCDADGDCLADPGGLVDGAGGEAEGAQHTAVGGQRLAGDAGGRFDQGADERRVRAELGGGRSPGG